MTIATVPDVSSKIYEIDFSPITLTSPMRKILFEFFKIAVFLAQQLEALALGSISSHFQETLIKSINEFNKIKDFIEDFITSN